MTIGLPEIWAFIIALAVFLYVVMDGFDLGLGILFPGLKVGEERDSAMNSIAPVWDGNETWLVMGGGGLMAVFPLAYAIILPALYAPIVAMLLALVFRGVAFEFRWRDPRHRPAWDFAFALGSTVAAFAQGVTLGALLQGIHVEGRAYAGGWWDWLTPFSLLTGASVVSAYAMLGATWLVMKAEGSARDHGLRMARKLVFVTIGAIVAVSLATPFLQGEYWRRWFEMPGILFAAPVPILVGIGTILLLRALAKAENDYAPFLLTLGLFGLCFVGLGISIFPDIVPGAVSIRAAAAPDDSLAFILTGAVVLIPLILSYTAWSYWVFRGKVGAHGYH